MNHVRDALPGLDAAACLAIYAPFVAESAASFEEEVPSVDVFTDRMRDTLESHAWLVCEDGRQIVGFAYGTQHRTRAAYRWAADVTVYVDPERHRSGIGRALYETLLDRLREQGFHVACAGITLPNDASVGLHESLGFEPVGVYRRIGWKAGEWHDVGWWQLELTPPTATKPDEPRPPTG